MPIRTNTRKMTALAACVLVGTLAACTGGEDPSPSPTSTLSAAPSGGSTAPSSSAAGGDSKQSLEHCEVPEGDASIPKEAPAVDEWADVAGVGVPTSKTYGPLVQDDGIWQCYEHSPTGALFATTYSIVGPASVEGAVEQWVRPEDRSAVAGLGTNTSMNQNMEIVGYKFRSYTADKVVIDVALRVTQDGQQVYVAAPRTLVWNEDRWVLDLTATEGDGTQLDASLPGFTHWSVNG